MKLSVSSTIDGCCCLLATTLYFFFLLKEEIVKFFSTNNNWVKHKPLKEWATTQRVGDEALSPAVGPHDYRCATLPSAE